MNTCIYMDQNSKSEFCAMPQWSKFLLQVFTLNYSCFKIDRVSIIRKHDISFLKQNNYYAWTVLFSILQLLNRYLWLLVNNSRQNFISLLATFASDGFTAPWMLSTWTLTIVCFGLYNVHKISTMIRKSSTRTSQISDHIKDSDIFYSNSSQA
jgi:hypothetical protein